MGRDSRRRVEVVLSQADILAGMLRAQHLAARASSVGVREVVGDLVGLHATLPTTPALSLLARLPEFRREALEHALYEERSLVRLKSIRQTVFVVPRAFVAPLMAATRRLLEVNGRRYLASTGVPLEACESLAPRITAALRGCDLSTAELRAALGGPRETAATVGLLCDRGVLVRTRPVAGWRDSANRYALLREWLPEVEPDAIPEREAVAWLVRLYLDRYGPVGERDVAWWTGLPMKGVRAALEALGPELVDVRVEGLGAPLLMLRARASERPETALDPGTSLVFLPVLDPYVMGYRERERYLAPEVADRVFDRGGNGTATIVLGGRVIGIWDVCERPSPAVRVHLFARPGDALLDRVYAQACRVGRFWFGADFAVQRVSAMQPLADRPTGAYSPFRNP